jgi:hypothetical protein
MRIEDFRDAESGPVALLGNGPSLAEWNLEELAERMPLFGINRSWKLIGTRWRCFVDAEHHKEFSSVAPPHEIAFHLSGNEPKIDGVTVHWRPRLVPGENLRFCGFELDVGTYGLFAGHFAVELAAWMGFNPIFLAGYDFEGGHFDDPDVERSPKEVALWRKMVSNAREVLEEAGVSLSHAPKDFC